MKENYYLTIGLPLLGSGIMGSFIWLILSIGKEGVERRDACFEQCVPFAHRLVEERCECLTTEGYWVPQHDAEED